MRRVMQWLGALVREICYGLDAGAAIRHGLPVPEAPRRRARRQSAIIPLEIIRRSDVPVPRRQRIREAPGFGADWHPAA